MKNIKIKNVAGWIFGVFFSFIGFVFLFSSLATGLFLILFGLILIPRVWAKVENKIPFNINRKGKIFLAIALFIFSVISVPSSNDQKISEVSRESVKSKTEEVILNEEISEGETESDTEVILKTETAEENNQTDSQVVENTYKVVSVVDGDTIKIDMNGKTETLRLIGIDTPETVDPRKPVQCFGTEASDKAKELLSGRKVKIEYDSTQGERDKYGRLLVYVYRDDGLFFNKAMIEQGYAYEYTYDTAYKYQSDFKSVQKIAQNNEKGLWSINTCNGDPNTGVEEPESAQNTSHPATVSSGGKFYTSSHHTAKYWYPESCDGWEGLSKSYLKVFNSLEELLSQYSRTKNPNCN